MSDERPLDRRGPGRPKEFEDPSQMTIALDSALHDQVIAEAQRMGPGTSVAAAARALLSWAITHRRTSAT
jgi:hypothetical protein